MISQLVDEHLISLDREMLDHAAGTYRGTDSMVLLTPESIYILGGENYAIQNRIDHTITGIVATSIVIRNEIIQVGIVSNQTLYRYRISSTGTQIAERVLGLANIIDVKLVEDTEKVLVTYRGGDGHLWTAQIDQVSTHDLGRGQIMKVLTVENQEQTSSGYAFPLILKAFYPDRPKQLINSDYYSGRVILQFYRGGEVLVNLSSVVLTNHGHQVGFHYRDDLVIIGKSFDGRHNLNIHRFDLDPLGVYLVNSTSYPFIEHQIKSVLALEDEILLVGDDYRGARLVPNLLVHTDRNLEPDWMASITVDDPVRGNQMVISAVVNNNRKISVVTYVEDGHSLYLQIIHMGNEVTTQVNQLLRAIDNLRGGDQVAWTLALASGVLLLGSTYLTIMGRWGVIRRGSMEALQKVQESRWIQQVSASMREALRRDND